MEIRLSDRIGSTTQPTTSTCLAPSVAGDPFRITCREHQRNSSACFPRVCAPQVPPARLCPRVMPSTYIYIHISVFVCMYVYMHARTHACMHGWMHQWTDGRTDRRTDGRTDGRMDGWMGSKSNYESRQLANRSTGAGAV